MRNSIQETGLGVIEVILAILQARSSSTRFPNKVLADLAGDAMIIQQINRLKKSKLINKIVVATSIDSSDDLLADLLESAEIPYYRGSLDNVLERFIEVIRIEKPKVVVRLTADCPLTDPSVIDLVISRHLASRSDYTSNTISPTFPDGLDVECVSPSALMDLHKASPTEIECEHVTYGLYSRPGFCAIESVKQDDDHSNLRWTVDIPEDLDFVRLVYAEFAPDYSSFTQEDLINLARLKPEFIRTDSILERNAGLNKAEAE
jgi:spore coat polysaccharide biosynthesis protein SpsF